MAREDCRFIAQTFAGGSRDQAVHARRRSRKRTFPRSVHDEAVALATFVSAYGPRNWAANRDPAGFVRADANNQNAVGPRNERLARDHRVVRAITHFGDSRFHVQFAAIVGDCWCQKTTAGRRLAGRLPAPWVAPEMLVGHLFGLLKLIREYQIANLREILERIGDRHNRAAGPDQKVIR